ncbi:hypothetical protein [Candidatus Phytoplasma solani]|uniref:hypothetical protein n=1 Tax=Candidatus Phytoplasma solani TaxID=69896 RepID=UPI0035902FCE
MSKKIIQIENEIKALKETIESAKESIKYQKYNLMAAEKTFYDVIKDLSLIKSQIRETVDKETIFNNIPQTLKNKISDLESVMLDVRLFISHKERITRKKEEISKLKNTLNDLKRNKK